MRDRLEREAREAIENARMEGKMLRREAGRKAKEDEDRGSNNENDEELTFVFPICDVPTTFGREVNMKNIPPSILPNLYGTSTEDPDSFLFFLMSCVELMDILMILRSLDCFQQL